MKKNIRSHRNAPSPNVMASSMEARPFLIQANPMDVLFGGPDPLMPNHQPVVGQRKAKKRDKAKRKRTQQARRANRK